MDDFTLLDRTLRSLIDEGTLPMGSMSVYRKGREVYRGKFGMGDIAAARPIDDGSVFRIFSMTKVITTVAVMQLYERGLLLLDDPVSKFIPSFARQEVYYVDAYGKPQRHPSRRQNTVRNLLTMTSGIPYYHPGRTPAEDCMAKVWERMDADNVAGKPWTTLRAVEEIGASPIEFEPGERYRYGLGIDVCGGIIEKVTGMRLGDYFRKYIFDPLGMADSDFYIHPEAEERFVTFYRRAGAGKFEQTHNFQDLRQLGRPLYEEGGDGIVTTVGDYMTFARMLLGGGTLGGVKILGRKSVELMSRNHLTPEQLPGVGMSMPAVRGYGWGLGVRVMIDPARCAVGTSVGEFGWFGHGGSWFCVDPAEDMAAVFMTNTLLDAPIPVTPRIVAGLYAGLE